MWSYPVEPHYTQVPGFTEEPGLDLGDNTDLWEVCSFKNGVDWDGTRGGVRVGRFLCSPTFPDAQCKLDTRGTHINFSRWEEHASDAGKLVVSRVLRGPLEMQVVPHSIVCC